MSNHSGWDQVVQSLELQEDEDAGVDPLAMPAGSSGIPAAGTTGANADGASVDWLMAILQQSMQELMTARIQPLQRASAIARLGSLFLRTLRTAELQQANKALQSRVKELEKRLAMLEAREGTASEASPRPGSDRARANAMPVDARPSASGADSSWLQPDQTDSGSLPAAEPVSTGTAGQRPPGTAAVCPAGSAAVAFSGPRGSP